MKNTLTCQKCRRPFPFTPAQQALCLEYHAEAPSLCPHCRQALRAAPVVMPMVPSWGLRRDCRHGRGYYQHYGGFFGRR